MKKKAIIILAAFLAAFVPGRAQDIPKDGLDSAKVLPTDQLLRIVDKVLAIEEVRLADIIFSDGRTSSAYEAGMGRFRALKAFRKEVVESSHMQARYTVREDKDGTTTIRDEKTGDVAVTLGKNRVLWYNPVYKDDEIIL